ncbi:FAS1-like dehydratase domain-containing protein [Brevibacterium album]|uniref:FAS1-like dehydratase domain-containing protein n=1 Tax=Brevibacterium album TaxID=417948 RepID=UPI000429CE0F|nr:MaoC family dehydratase N-terminal domain-containing protein [Brevibacterium album]
MAVNTELQGASYSLPQPYEVSREAIAEFARAVGAENPAHFDAEAARGLGYADVVAPATFPVIPSQRCEGIYISSPEAGIDYSRVVHGQEQFEYVRPVVAGDRLAATTHVDGLREAGGNAMITTRTELSDAESGDLVVTVTSTIVVRGEK